MIDSTNYTISSKPTEEEQEFLKQNLKGVYENKQDGNGQHQDQKQKKEIVAYKYSRRGKYRLHEAVILAGRPAFITYNRYSSRKKKIL